MPNDTATILPGRNAAGARFVGRPADRSHSMDHRHRRVSTARFVNAMRGAATGVNIVTTDGTAGRYGITVSAFSSVSAEPPMLLVCINRRSPVCDALATNRCFTVNVLSTLHESLANTFAGKADAGAPYDFGAACWKESATGAPMLAGSVAGFDCTLTGTLDAGTHRIFIGTVVEVATAASDPLLYSNRMYGRVSR